MHTNLDILVAGGGLAGVMAAVGAKRRGHRVLLIEPHNVLGGQGTAGGVAGFCGDTARVNAPFRALVEKLTAWNAIHAYDPLDDRRDYELEWCAFALQELVEESAIEVLLYASVVAASAREGLITDVTVATFVYQPTSLSSSPRTKYPSIPCTTAVVSPHSARQN